MIAMGAGTNHWYHSDQIYRSFLTLIMLCGCQGVNGGGWAHYVGREKVRPLAGWQQMAFALLTVGHDGTWVAFAVWAALFAAMLAAFAGLPRSHLRPGQRSS